MNLFIFYVLAGTALISALAVVIQKRAVFSALALIICMASIALLYVQLDATFIATIQVIVYAGAIMVLFLFVIMLLDPTAEEKQTESVPGVKYFAIPFGILLATLIGQVIFSYQWRGVQQLPAASGVASVGMQLFSSYLLTFEVTSILILVAILGAVMMAKKKV